MGKAPISGGGTATTEVVDYTYGTDAADILESLLPLVEYWSQNQCD
jgi:hypothetical protein